MSNPTIRANLLEIKKYFEKIELDGLYSQESFLNIFRYLMRLAIEGIPEPMLPLPAIIYFIKYLIFGSFKSLPLERQITIYRHFLELLAESGSDWIINSEKAVELGV